MSLKTSQTLKKLRHLSLPEAWVLFFLLLCFQFQYNTFFQQNMIPIIFWTPVFALLLLLTLLRLPKILIFSPQLLWWGLFFGIYVSVSGYYPERDNDGISFWMPKVRALQLYGFLPAVDFSDPRFTISHNYPLGMVSLSAFLHSFSQSFDIRLHRAAAAFQSFVLWWQFFHLSYKLRLSRFWSQFLMLLLVGIQPAIWTHGYHDATWALSGALGIYYLLYDFSLPRAAIFLVFAMMGKVEANLILGTSLIAFAILQKKPRWLLLLIPSFLWIFILKYLHFPSSREISWPPYSFHQVLLVCWKNTLPLLKFQTLYGATSVALFLCLKEIWGIKKSAFGIFLWSFAIYFVNYMFSSFEIEWNIKFSWPRIILFPLFLIIFLKHFQDSELLPSQN